MLSEQEPVRYVGHTMANIDYHHGQLRPAVGVQSYQVFRANRSHPELAEAYGWTYNHAPMLAYWNNRFYLEYLSTPIGEHIPPGQTLVTTSVDGRSWEKPQVVFPPYVVPHGVYPDNLEYKLAPGTYSVMHQRMGFYVAPNGRLLVLAFYGICPHYKASPQDGRGIGRVVREAYADGTFGPIYFIRYNRHMGWNETNTRYPFYTQSSDKGFVEACEALLADRLVTLQWWEEDRSNDGFFTTGGYEALSYYHARDGKVVGLWKWSRAAISDDEGKTWSPIVRVPSLVMAGAKIWGQRTSDGRYALVYNPSTHGYHRWPLAIITGDDGYTFDNMLLVNGEVPPRRFYGNCKDFGPQYVRGIAEGNGTPPGGDMWITYSMNKEDIWVSRIPVPVRATADVPVNDTFSDVPPGGAPQGWNIHSPCWAPVSVVAFPGSADRSLELRDEDPYDYAKAERVFPESARLTIDLRLMARQANTGQLFIEVVDGRNQAALRLRFDPDGRIRGTDSCIVKDLGAYAPDTWYDISITPDTREHRWALSIPALGVDDLLAFDSSVSTVERIVLRTGPERHEPAPWTPRDPGEDLPGADNKVAPAVYDINRLTTSGHVRP